MTEVIGLDRLVQLGVESTPLTAVPATTRLQTVKINTDPDTKAEMFLPSGSQFPTVATLSKEQTNAKITGKPSFGELPYVFSSPFGAATITTPGGGSISRQWLWNLYGTVLPAPKVYTLEEGDSVQANQVPGFTFSGCQLKFDRAKIDLTGAGFGGLLNAGATLTSLVANSDVQTLTISATGGTFTVTVRGVTTGAVAFGAAAATLQTAITGLASVGAGNCAVTGSAGGPFTITFQGALGNQLIPTITTNAASLTGGASTATIVHTTPGVAIYPEPVAQPIVGNQIDIYVDSSSGAIGGTQFLRNFEATWNFSDVFDQAYPLNSALTSYGATAPKAPKATLMLGLAMDAQGRSLLTAIRAGSTQYVRLKSTGPVIEGSIHYSLTIDLAVKISDVGAEKMINGIYCRDYTATLIDDASWGKAGSITLVNTLLSL